MSGTDAAPKPIEQLPQPDPAPAAAVQAAPVAPTAAPTIEERLTALEAMYKALCVELERNIGGLRLNQPPA